MSIRQSIRVGSGLVEIRSSPFHYKRPQVEDIERILGSQTGDTNARDLPEGIRTSMRWNALGRYCTPRCFDARAMAHILNELSWSPVDAVVMEREVG